MTNEKAIADHWAKGDVYARIVSALGGMSKSLDAVTLEDLAPVDHFHARGFPATVELADLRPSTLVNTSLTLVAASAAPLAISRNGFNAR